MERPRIVLWGLLCILVASGCVSSSRRNHGLSITPFKKKSATASTTPKQPLTQVALDALKVKPKKKANVRIVSPLDWFRGSANDASQLSAEQMTELAEKYRAAVAERVVSGQTQIASSQPSSLPLSRQPQPTNAANLMLPSQASTPLAPQFPTSTVTSNVNATLTQLAAMQPTIQLQSGQLPTGQPQFAQLPTAHYATAAGGLPPKLSPAIPRSGPHALPSTLPPPPIAAPAAGTPYASTIVPSRPSPQPIAPPTATTYPATSQPYYPTTNQRPLPNLSTSVKSAFGPTYR